MLPNYLISLFCRLIKTQLQNKEVYISLFFLFFFFIIIIIIFFFTTDIDECRTVEGVCYNGHCQNTIGSYLCSCPRGFQLTRDGKECRGITNYLCL